ncbi:rhomboid family intramembrane serine protease [Ornithinibacillus californiensis]|uniref:rhomboid family intramembrane serine protease n=1 Tax=Ornithinibacillus californiensis TaxID=161536 RepID=UPI00064E1140|nr:rhomboid family intramembrane serine protease [Ornithinibacillus californiensis]
MEQTEQTAKYIMYTYAHQLVTESDFQILYLNNNMEEIWLEKYADKTSKIVRISTIGFDWKNHLKKDIAIVFQKTSAMRKLLKGKDVTVHNVYISPHTPIDDWEILKKPLVFQEKNPIRMMTYYLSGEEVFPERNRLEKNIHVSFVDDSETVAVDQMEETVNRKKLALYKLMQEKKKKEESILSYGKPIVTYLLIVINAILFLLLELNGGSENHTTLIEYGAKYNPLIIEGEWWRIITSMFLHIGLIHFASNMLFLFYFGSLAEKIYGSSRFLFIFLLAGIGGGITSFTFVTNLSAGASGALYGLFGAFIYFGLFHKRIFFQTIGKDILILLGINVILGFVLPQLDVAAHFGGLIAGFVAAGIVHFPKKRKMVVQVVSLIVYFVLANGLYTFAIQYNNADASYHLMNIDRLLLEERYEEVVESASKGLEDPDDMEAILLFQRSYAYIQLNEIELAVVDLEQCIQVLENPNELPEAFYNLAILYHELGDSKAEAMIKQAYELKPSDNNVEEMYETITGEKLKGD